MSLACLRIHRRKKRCKDNKKKLEYATPKKPLPSDFAYSETVFANSESHQMEKTISDGLRGYLAVLRIHVETV